MIDNILLVIKIIHKMKSVEEKKENGEYGSENIYQ